MGGLRRGLAAVLAALAGSAGVAQAQPDEQVLIGRLFDARNGIIGGPSVVVITEGRVACSGHRLECVWSDGAEIHDFGEATILPGLIDLHVHARAHYAAAFPASGVTMVRDANNTFEALAAIRAAPVAPRLIASGPMLDSPDSVIASMSATAGRLGKHPIGAIMPIFVDDAASAAAAVDARAAAGAAHVKVYETIGEDAFRAAAARASEHGMAVMADIGTAFTRGLTMARLDIVQIAEAGADTVEHMSGLALAYQRRGGDPLDETLDSAILDAIAEDLLASGAAFVPTLANGHQFAGTGALDTGGFDGAARLSPFLEGQWTAVRGFAEAAAPRTGADRRLSEAMLVRLIEGGALIGAGSDIPAAPGMLPGAGLHMELEALTLAGLSPDRALQAATINAARIIGRDDLGHLQPGAIADIVVVDGSPLSDIRVTRRVLAVWQAGEPLDVAAAWDGVAADFEAVMQAYEAAQAEAEGED
jgi:imidazolonepropionase-like amidohydrolase